MPDRKLAFWKRLKVSFYIIIALQLFVTLADPWSLSETTEQQSVNLLHRFAAPWYRSNPDAKTTGRMISVVMIDDLALEAMGNKPFPLPYDDQVEMLDRISFADPAAVFIDFLYADDRGQRSASAISDTHSLGYLSSELSMMAAEGGPRASRDGRDRAYAEAYFPRLRTNDDGDLPGGYLVADEIVDAPSRLPQYDAIGPHDRQKRLNIANLPAAPSKLLGDPMRYALAPDGILAPAVILATMACDVLREREDVRDLEGCKKDGYAVTLRGIHNASKAAAEWAVASDCSDIVRRALAAPDRKIDTPAHLKAQCRTAAARYTANASWVGPAPASEPGTLSGARKLHDYARVRRDALFEGSRIAMQICIGDETERHNTLREWALPFIDRCTGLADDAEDRKSGPVMSILWASAPQDGGPLRDSGVTRMDFENDVWRNGSTVAAAPYSWAEVNGKPIDDTCFRFRHADTYAARWHETGLRLLGTVLNPWFSYLDTCAYHAQMSPLNLASDAAPTVRYVQDALRDRVVIVAASVKGAADTHAMRNVIAPGAWAHAMALDNLLVLGDRYRWASFDGNGFEASGIPIVSKALLEALIALLLVAGLTVVPLKRAITICSERRYIPWITPAFAEFAMETLIGGFLAMIVALLLATMFVVYIPFMPPLDWIGIAGLATLGWGAADHSVPSAREDPAPALAELS